MTQPISQSIFACSIELGSLTTIWFPSVTHGILVRTPLSTSPRLIKGPILYIRGLCHHAIIKSFVEILIQIYIAQTYLGILVLWLCLVLGFGVPETFSRSAGDDTYCERMECRWERWRSEWVGTTGGGMRVVEMPGLQGDGGQRRLAQQRIELRRKEGRYETKNTTELITQNLENQ